jgi:hypothetical protein
MRTPAGKECRYFYGDYYRGRKREECRLLAAATPPERWTPDLCGVCPVPDILLANACKYMALDAEVTRPFPFIRRKVSVKTTCGKTQRKDFDPFIGCGECHPIPEVFKDITGDTNPAP